MAIDREPSPAIHTPCYKLRLTKSRIVGLREDSVAAEIFEGPTEKCSFDLSLVPTAALSILADIALVSVDEIIVLCKEQDLRRLPREVLLLGGATAFFELYKSSERLSEAGKSINESRI